MVDVDAQHALEMAAIQDQQPVETLGADGADEPLGVGVCLWCSDRRVDHLDALAPEDLVEGGGELAVVVVDQEAHPLEHAGKAEIARLLGYPGAGRVGRAARQVDLAVSEFDEEEHVEAAQRDRVDREEVARQHARSLLAEEVAPARACTPRGWLETGAEQDAPHRARRDTQAELEQLAGDPRVAPTRVLACESQHELAHLIINGWTAGSPRRLRPLAADEFAMPAQKRLRRHDQSVAPPPREQAHERGEEGTISRL